MAAPESLNTMEQNSYVKLADGSYAVQTTGSSGGGSTPATVKLDQTDPNNSVRILAGQVVTIAEPLFSRATSVFANGKQAAPAANTTIAATANLAIGSWDIEANVAILGTTVANVEATNVVFKIGATTVATPTINVPGVAGSTAPAKFRCRVTLGAPSPVSIASGGSAATAGSIYVADIVATPWEGP